MDNTIFMFNVLSADKTPGSGVMEYIKSEDKKNGLYKELSKIDNWRKKLSNEYLISLSIDDNEWLSVEHYCFANVMKKKCMFDKLDDDWQTDKITNLKSKFKITNNDYVSEDLDKALQIKFDIPEFKHILSLTKNATLTTWKRGQNVNITKDNDKEIKTANTCVFTEILMKIRSSIPVENDIVESTSDKVKRRSKKSQLKSSLSEKSTKDNSCNKENIEKDKNLKKEENVPNHFEINISSHSQNLKILSKKEFNSSSDLNSSYNPLNNKSNNTLTIYEKTNIIGTRMEQLAMGCESFLSPKEEKELNCVKKIAHLEFERKLIPFVICRTLPDNTKEYWKLCDMI